MKETDQNVPVLCKNNVLLAYPVEGSMPANFAVVVVITFPWHRDRDELP